MNFETVLRSLRKAQRSGEKLTNVENNDQKYNVLLETVKKGDLKLRAILLKHRELKDENAHLKSQLEQRSMEITSRYKTAKLFETDPFPNDDLFCFFWLIKHFGFSTRYGAVAIWPYLLDGELKVLVNLTTLRCIISNMCTLRNCNADTSLRKYGQMKFWSKIIESHQELLGIEKSSKKLLSQDAIYKHIPSETYGNSYTYLNNFIMNADIFMGLIQALPLHKRPSFMAVFESGFRKFTDPCKLGKDCQFSPKTCRNPFFCITKKKAISLKKMALNTHLDRSDPYKSSLGIELWEELYESGLIGELMGVPGKIFHVHNFEILDDCILEKEQIRTLYPKRTTKYVRKRSSMEL